MKCAGQDSRFWDFESIFTISCPHCAEELEFFKDDTNLTCKKCGHLVLNPKMDFGCASYCKFAAQCLGTLPPELLSQRQNLLKNRLSVEVKHYFGRDFTSISRVVKMVNYAERINKNEKGNPGIVMPGAYLYYVGIPEARKILFKCDAENEVIDEICQLLTSCHDMNGEQSKDIHILQDAARLVLLKEEEKALSTHNESTEAFINKNFLTETGRTIAQEMLRSID